MKTPSPEILDQVDEKVAAVKAAVGGGGVVVYSLTLNEWVAVATIAYMILQIGLLVPKYYMLIRNWRKRNDRRS